MKRFLTATVLLYLSLSVLAQQERVDTLDAAVYTAGVQGNFISKGKDIRTEVISTAGLQKMACCNLAESFENSASVTVGYSDATTGARQIRLLGLSGIYTQILDENRPAVRGLSAPFGLSYFPGSWLESIQIAKGSPSVINGVESMTGQINLEHKKPTDQKPLFINASIMNDTKSDLNILSSLELSEKVYTILMGHVDGNFKTYDMNGDGFADDPALLQFDVANRWVYYTPEFQARWGIKAVRDNRRGGQTDGPWVSDVLNQSMNGYFKVGYSWREDASASIALVGDYTFAKMDSSFGLNFYDAREQSGFLNLIYRNAFNERHDFTAGINFTSDIWAEDAIRTGLQTVTDSRQAFIHWGPYAEYTFKQEEKFSIIAGIAGVFHGGEGFYPVPRLTMKYQPVEAVVIRANGGRGLRRANPVMDNIGILSTGKYVVGDLTSRPVEDSWTFGGNISFFFSEHTSLSLDYFRTAFSRQLLLDRETPNTIVFYALDSHRSWSDSYQADFSTEPVERLTFTLTARYTDARAWQPSSDEIREIALSSRFKGVFNAQYKTRLSKWIFDFTASLNGSSRVYDFMLGMKDGDGALLYPEGMTPVYPLLYAQVTRRFRGIDLYLGGENLTGYMQECPIVHPEDPFSTFFDAASVWGPLMGAKIYAGLRITIWK